MGKLTLTEHLKACAEAAKNFTNGLVGELAQTVADAMNEINDVKADKSDLTVITIPISGWQGDQSVTDYPVYYDIADKRVTAKDRASVMIAPSSMGDAIACGMCPTCETMVGIIRIRAGSIPTTVISAEYWIEQGKE